MARANGILVLCLATALVSSAASAGQQLQGQQLQGQQLQGQQLQGTNASGFPATAGAPALNFLYDGWLLGWRRLGPARVDRGTLVIDDGGRALTGAALVGAIIPADRGGQRVWAQIRSVEQDPTFADGSTALYTIDVFAQDGSRSALCSTDASGVAAALPVAALFDGQGNRVESTTQFSFGCTAGVIAKCYRWGYRPWLQPRGASQPSQQFADLHWACTRMARADYCGDGQTWTHNGTLINLWDRAPAPGPFQDHGAPPADFVFEAGWSTQGAVCLSKQRWATLPPELAQRCPNRLVAPGAVTGVGTVCDTQDEALRFDTTTQLFNESRLNVQH